MEKQRIQFLDLLRIVAAFAVIVIHVSTQFWKSESINSYNWIFMNSWDAISRWAVPVFVMISGCLFLSRKDEISIKILFKKYILRIACAFIVWTIIYGIVALFIYRKSFETVMAILTTGYFHMWYLFAIAGVYLLYPLLLFIIKDKNRIKYFLIIVFILNFLVANVLKLCDVLVPMANNQILSHILNNVHSNLSYLLPGDILGYSFYFILGYYLYKHEISKKQTNYIFGLAILGLIITVFGSIIASRLLGKPSDIFFGYFSINVLLISVGIFTLFKKVFGIINIAVKSELVEDISNCCFGIYLSHVLVLELLTYYFDINANICTSIISIPVVSILIFIICYMLIHLLRKIGILKKYVI